MTQTEIRAAAAEVAEYGYVMVEREWWARGIFRALGNASVRRIGTTDRWPSVRSPSTRRGSVARRGRR